ncbi:nucleolar protein 8 [Spea bombifrons]|uniref:nucleolar protein 8 n=1 Tax=Spea bombifrons TaxID=233779 RepID=UPI002349996C|nr:nucleolar protein 8 [Spea bombifrons]
METSLKRLYVGGIGPSVTDAELTERFGRFGKVSDVDIISRKDEHGNPVKTFAYLNISISEADLKKCVSVLNKTKWKGGVLQIEMAKESFLHRLSQERQIAKEKKTPEAESKCDLMQSLKDVGVNDFQLKAAVPGTEVPNHKNWVVSKFGRVLPVLHLKNKKHNKIIKYDPSKYCHNIKKVEESSVNVTPISQLTWHLDGGDDDMSRKRRGEFPVSKGPTGKKLKLQEHPDVLEQADKQGCNHKNTSGLKTFSKNKKDVNGGLGISVSDEHDSEDEFRAVLESEKTAAKVGIVAEDSNIEVVDDSYMMSYNSHWARGSENIVKRSTKEDDEYDSADTDEIIAVAKTVPKVKDAILSKNKENRLPLHTAKQKGNLRSKGMRNDKEEPEHTTEDEADLESENGDSESDDSYSDPEYDAMMQNCYRISLSLGDLEKLANASKESSEDEKTDGDHIEEDLPNKSEKPVPIQKGKRGIEPDDIVASILDDSDDSSDEKQRRKRKKGPPTILPAFKGLGSLLSSAPSQETNEVLNSFSGPSVIKSCANIEAKGVRSKACRGSEAGATIPAKEVEPEARSGKNGGSRDGHQGGQQASSLSKVKRNNDTVINENSSSSDSYSSDEGSTSDTSSAAVNTIQGTSEKKDRGIAKQLEDNQKRLAAMEERRKERELQKQTIQGALLKLDSQPSSKSQHIKFDSDSEEQSEEELQTMKNDIKTISSEKVQNPAAKLFESSDDEEDDDGKEDSERFQIKSQFEGRSGVKLMNLQSRFGTDERFQMDSRFLDTSSEDETDETKQNAPAEEGEDDLTAEKKKNLGILSSLLNIGSEPLPPSKQAAKAKTFKDLNALQYDPTREDHATFETQTEEEKKETKSERKKKRLEAEKLPEVSAEIYHEVAVDLKEVFGTSKPTTENEAASTTWDQEEEPVLAGNDNSLSHEYFSFQKTEEPAGFTFSFFGPSTEDSVSKEETYKIETIKPAKVAWQEDPRFQDSSSEGEDEEVTVTKESTLSTQSESAKNISFFFFVKGDERLKAGPKMFCRSSNLDEEQEAWEERRESLLEECRKRHKDAKRKIKSKH